MALSDYRKTQLEKRRQLLAKSNPPYPQSTKRTHTVGEANKDFAKLKRQSKRVVLTGRIVTLRRHGGATFVNIKDTSGMLQLLLRRDNMGISAYKEATSSIDVGDFVEVAGVAVLTKHKEQTLDTSSLRLLAKAIRPIPEKWHGLKDVEERYRKRYLDLLINPEIQEIFLLRSKIFRSTREFLIQEGFVDVETPVLQHIPGGASARPFKTHLNSFDIDLYLRVAPELYLKRLLIGGMEKVFEIGRMFRNEGVDHSHNPDFTMLEFYWAYADYKDIMKLTEKMIMYIAKSVGKEALFKGPWKRVEFVDLLKKYAKVDYESVNQKELAKTAKKLGLSVEKYTTKARIADDIYKKVCLPKIVNPTFILHYPASLFPLAKTLKDKPEYAACFQLAVAGWELTKAFSEQNDPVVQRKSFEEQEKHRKEGDEEAQRLDNDFLEALEYGMPPAAGIGIGMDRFVALLAGANSLREVILFPLMKPKGGAGLHPPKE